LQYIQLVSHYRLSKQIKLQSEAFFEGLLEMIDTNWLRWVLSFRVGNPDLRRGRQYVQSTGGPDLAWRRQLTG
jgi:hypothetical protein